MSKKVRRPVPEKAAEAIRRGLAGRSRKPDSPEMKRRIARAMKHAEAENDAITSAAMSDPDNLPPEGRGPGRPAMPEHEKRQQVTMKLDPRILNHFKGDSPKGWQTRVNNALLEFIGEKD